LESPVRILLRRGVKYCLVIVGISVFYILADFSVDVRPPQIQGSYQFRIDDLLPDNPRILRQDNLAIVLIRRSPATIQRLEDSVDNLQDPDSSNSHQPDGARNRLRSLQPEFFVSYAQGTDLGCPLLVEANGLRESCGSARYDFAGRALRGENRFQNLSIPDYNFTSNFKTLTIRP
jgi:ubiquinol-cytochrome c reductase iron-sulfur subunit